MGNLVGWQFHGYTLDTPRRLLTRDEETLHLTPKAFDLLVVLVVEAPRVVPKAELHRRLWPDTFVTDATLTGVVKELRRILTCATPLIRTAHGIGYAFTGTIESSGRDLPASRSLLIAGSRHHVLVEGVNEIGRDPRAQVWIDSPRASRRHAKVTVCGPSAMLEDLGSKNCTLVNDQVVTTARSLVEGDVIQVGDTLLTYRLSDVDVTTEGVADRRAAELAPGPRRDR